MLAAPHAPRRTRPSPRGACESGEGASIAPPMTLPGDAIASSVPAARRTWIKSAHAPEPQPAPRRAGSGARHIGPAARAAYALAPSRAPAASRSCARAPRPARLRAAEHAGRAVPRSAAGPAVRTARQLARRRRRPVARTASRRRHQPADRAGRRPARPTHAEWQGDPATTLAQFPGHQPARHGDRVGRRGAQNGIGSRRLAGSAGAQRLLAPSLTPRGGHDHVPALGGRSRPPSTTAPP